MLWYATAVSLRDHLTAQMPGVDVSLGATQEVPDTPTVKVRALRSDKWPVKKLFFDGKLEFALETWIRRGEIDREPYYLALAEMHRAILTALRTWALPTPYEVCDLYIAFDADDDRFLTGVGALLVLHLEWKSTDF